MLDSWCGAGGLLCLLPCSFYTSFSMFPDRVFTSWLLLYYVCRCLLSGCEQAGVESQSLKHIINRAMEQCFPPGMDIWFAIRLTQLILLSTKGANITLQ